MGQPEDHIIWIKGTSITLLQTLEQKIIPR
jgi:hypothetical protein